MNNIELILPEIFISLSIMFLLILGVFKENSSKIIHNISLLVLLITAVITFNETISINPTILFNGHRLSIIIYENYYFDSCIYSFIDFIKLSKDF